MSDHTAAAGTLPVVALAEVVYSSGRVFEGLSVSRLDTDTFLRSGSLEGVAMRADRLLLQDLRDAAQLVVDHASRTVDVGFVKAVNATFARSGALHPGQLRTEEQAIGVATAYGRHTPGPLTEASLQVLIDNATRGSVPAEIALDLFVGLAKAQPFEDANKRTAVFVANSVLIGAGAGSLLTVPVDDDEPRVAGEFHELLARAYIEGDQDGVKEYLRALGLRPLNAARGED